MKATLEQCAVTQKANVYMTAEDLQKLVEGFARFGVSKAQIEERTQCRIDAIQPTQVISLRNIWKSIREGMSSP